jgi:hypothetical protein
LQSFFLVTREFETAHAKKKYGVCSTYQDLKKGSVALGAHLHIVDHHRWDKLKQTLPVRLGPEPLIFCNGLFFWSLVILQRIMGIGNVPRT